MTRALRTDDWELYQKLFFLPVTIAPKQGRPYVLTTLDQLRQDLSLYRSAFLNDRITDILRTVLDVEELDPDQDGGPRRWRITAGIEMMSGSQRLTPGLRTVFVMVDSPEGLRIQRVESALGHIRWMAGEGSLHGLRRD